MERQRGVTRRTLSHLLFTYFQGQSRNLTNARRWAFRYFAESLDLTRDDWEKALHGFLRLSPPIALEAFLAFPKRLEAKGVPRERAERVFYSIRPFFEFLWRRGMIGWRPRHIIRDRSQARWASCSRSFQQLSKEWIRTLSLRQLSKYTIQNYKLDLLSFGLFLRRIGVEPRGISYPVAERWLKESEKPPGTSFTSYKMMTAGSMFSRWLVAVGELRRNPFQALPPRRRSRPPPRYASEEAILRLIDGAKSLRARALLEFLYATGCRIGEVARINLADLSLRDRVGTVLGKGKRERRIYLNHASIHAIQAYLPEREKVLKRSGHEDESALFVSYYGRRLNPIRLTIDVQEVAKRVGLEGITPHCIRHSFATHLLNRGASFEVVMRLLGHAHPESTAAYAQFLLPRIRRDYRLAKPRH